MPPSTLVPTSRMISACCAPNDFSAPSAKIGMVSLALAANNLLSDASYNFRQTAVTRGLALL